LSMSRYDGEELLHLEMNLFKEGNGPFNVDPAIERLVEKVEKGFMDSKEVIDMKYFNGAFDCCYHSITQNEKESISGKELTTLAAVTFNKLRLCPIVNIRCLSLMQYVDENGRYDNVLIFQALDDFGDGEAALPGKFAICTRGKWNVADRDVKDNGSLDIHFYEVGLRALPSDLHGAFATFKYLDSSYSPSQVCDEQIHFLALIGKNTLITTKDEVVGVNEGGKCGERKGELNCADLDPPFALTATVNINASTNVTFVDEERWRIMRGCKGGLYVLLRSVA